MRGGAEHVRRGCGSCAEGVRVTCGSKGRGCGSKGRGLHQTLTGGGGDGADAKPAIHQCCQH